MRYTLKIIAAATAMAVPLAAPSALAGDEAKMEKEAANTVVDVAAGNENFSTLVAAVKAAGLVETLSGDGPFTVFAPTNDAFEALPGGTVEGLLEPENEPALKMVLTYHVVAGKVEASDLVKLIRENDGRATITTVEGGTFEAAVKNGDVVLTDGAGTEIRVVNANISAGNGVVHVIDGVLMPVGSGS